MWQVLALLRWMKSKKQVVFRVLIRLFSVLTQWGQNLKFKKAEISWDAFKTLSLKLKIQGFYYGIAFQIRPSANVISKSLLLSWTHSTRLFYYVTGKKMSDVLIYSSINPHYSIPLLGRFTLIIHQNSTSRTSTVHRLFWVSRA